ncbi:MAG: hypothetical protein AB7S26_30445 [Sandaracinaceae bacterium]
MGSRLERYLRGLPDGYDSYPAYVQKASMYRTFLARLGGHAPDESDLPRELTYLLRDPLPASAWIPEAHAHALLHAVCDLRFADEARFVDQMLEVNRAILSSPLYRFLMIFASPTQVVKGAARSWGHVHRGVKLRVTLEGSGGKLRLAYPDHLLDELVTRCYATAFTAGLRLCGATDVNVEVCEVHPTLAVLEAGWR